MKNKKIKLALKIIVAVILCSAISYGLLYGSMYISGFLQINKNIEFQDNHLEYLKNEYYTESYMPCDEQKFADFNIEKAFSEGVKINEIAVIGTHNSYQLLATPQKRALENVRSFLSSGKKGGNRNFEMDTYTEQLERGVRNLEIDIETVDNEGDISFITTHNPITDNASSAYDFAKGLEEIAMWSDNNPGHLPVYLLVEPKGKVPAVNKLKNFSFEYALELDKVLRKVLGNRLLTPKQIMGGYGSLEEMRMADDWPTLKESAGKIIVLLHPCGVTQDYIDVDKSITTQAMLPVLGFEEIDKSYASFILDNEPEVAMENNKKTVHENNLMVRTRADNYPDFSNERYSLVENCGSHIITTDYPPRIVRPYDHVYDFDGYMMKLIK